MITQKLSSPDGNSQHSLTVQAVEAPPVCPNNTEASSNFLDKTPVTFQQKVACRLEGFSQALCCDVRALNFSPHWKKTLIVFISVILFLPNALKCSSVEKAAKEQSGLAVMAGDGVLPHIGGLIG